MCDKGQMESAAFLEYRHPEEESNVAVGNVAASHLFVAVKTSRIRIFNSAIKLQQCILLEAYVHESVSGSMPLAS
jgi:hypothetical protein